MVEDTPESPPVAVAASEADARPAGTGGMEHPRLIYDRSHEPSDDSPILYRERAYCVDGLRSDRELAEHLLAELASIRHEWRHRDTSQFVQLASFDHMFDTEPQFPPLATLSWKDWQGRPEIWVRGVRRSGLPEAVAFDGTAAQDLAEPAPESEVAPAEHALAPEDDEPLSGESQRVPGAEGARGILEEPIPLVAKRNPASERQLAAHRPDSGPGWPSPTRSGQYRIPQLEDEAVPPPSSQRVLASEELMGALFERMGELFYLADVAAGARYVLETLEEVIPCSGALLHLFDVDTRQFQVLRAHGPRAAELTGMRTPGLGSHLEEALELRATLRLDGSTQTAWQRLGLTIQHGLCSPVHRRGRYLGAIELGRAPGNGDFSDAQLKAVEYVCEQFAEFVADRPLGLDPAPLGQAPG